MKKILLVAVAVVFGGGCRGDGLLSPNVLTYSATSRIVPFPFDKQGEPSVETAMFIKNHTDNTVTFNYSRDNCDGLELHVFRSPGMSGNPVWKSAVGGVCETILYGPSAVAAGDSVEVVMYVPVSSILGTDLPSGTYYFDVLQHIGGGDIRETPVHIPAGSGELIR
jgi:hypothetical protein